MGRKFHESKDLCFAIDYSKCLEQGLSIGTPKLFVRWISQIVLKASHTN